MPYVVVHGRGLSGSTGHYAVGGPLRLTIEHLDGLGAAPAPMSFETRTKLIQDVVVGLTLALKRSKEIADSVVSRVPLHLRLTAMDWRDTVNAQSENLVVQLITPGRGGVYPFERAPKLIDDVASFIVGRAREMGVAADEMFSVAGVLAQLSAVVSGTLARASAEVGETAGKAAQAAVDAALKNLKPGSSIGAGVVVVGVAAVLAAYVWRSFR